MNWHVYFYNTNNHEFKVTSSEIKKRKDSFLSQTLEISSSNFRGFSGAVNKNHKHRIIFFGIFTAQLGKGG